MLAPDCSESMPTQSQDIAKLLERVNDGDESANDVLLALLYDELHAVAGKMMRGQPPGHTLQATALVSEAYLKLMKPGASEFNNRKHFIGRAACAMRCILIDHIRKPRPKKVPLDQIVVQFDDRAIDLLALDDALVKLKEMDTQMAEAIEMRFFGGLTVREVAEVQGLSIRKVERDWTFAKAWLFREMS